SAVPRSPGNAITTSGLPSRSMRALRIGPAFFPRSGSLFRSRNGEHRKPDLGNAPTPGPLAGESIRSARLAIAVPAVSVDQDLETERDVDAVERGEHECPVGEVTTTADEDAGHDSPLGANATHRRRSGHRVRCDRKSG